MGRKKKKEAKSTERQAYGLTVLKASHRKIRQLKRKHEPEIHGNKLWTSSWLIMDFLEQQGLPKKPRVMEVGCGWGLAGIYCAKRHRASVLGIDADENVFPYLDLHAEVNGVKLQGIISWFDNFSVLLRRDAHVQLVYKHAISTVMPAQTIQLFDPNKDNRSSPRLVVQKIRH